MSTEKVTWRVCPICGIVYHGYPAISRLDNKTEICSECGIRQALASIGIGADEQDRILQLVSANTGKEAMK